MKTLSFISLFIAVLPGIALAGDQPSNIAEGTIYRDKSSAEVVNIFSFRKAPKSARA